MKNKFKHLLSGTIFEKIGDFLYDEDGNYSVPAMLIKDSNEWFEIDENPNNLKINNFINGWKPLSQLVLEEIREQDLYIWCEYPSGGESRKCKIDHIKGTYIYCDVEFVINKYDKNRRLAQGAVAYSIVKNDKLPYISELHRNIWRQIVKLTKVRQIFYKKYN